MTNVLIRDVPPDDLDLIRTTASEQGTSLQRFLLDAILAQAAYLRRQAALAAAAEHLRGQSAVPEAERTAVLDAMDEAHDQRADALSYPRAR